MMVTIFVYFVIVCHVLYGHDAYEKCVNEARYRTFDMQSMLDAKLWHANFGHIYCSNLVHPH